MSHFMPAHYQSEPDSNARVGICLPCDLAGALVGAADCNCPKALSLLMQLGAIHAAQMHAAEAEKNPSHWTAEDWYAHMQEEEELFLPLLPVSIAAQLLEEHKRFRMELGIYGSIRSDVLLGQHFHAEEQWAEYLIAHLPGDAASVSGAVEDTKPGTDTGKIAAVLAIGFGLAMLIMRMMKAR
jgi:hypothetical protein